MVQAFYRSRGSLHRSVLALAGCTALLFAASCAKRKEAEAKGHVLAILRAEEAYFAAHGTYLEAGPTPHIFGENEEVPFVPDSGFAALGFRPPRPVMFTYRVKVTGPRAAVISAERMTDCCSGSTLELRAKLGPGESETVEVIVHDRRK